MCQNVLSSGIWCIGRGVIDMENFYCGILCLNMKNILGWQKLHTPC